MADIQITNDDHAYGSGSNVANRLLAVEVLRLMTNEGLSQSAACQQVGTSTSTFKRTLALPAMRNMLKSLVQDRLSEVLGESTEHLPMAVKKLREIIMTETDNELVISAIRELRQITTSVLGLFNQQEELSLRFAERKDKSGSEEKPEIVEFKPTFIKVKVEPVDQGGQTR